MVADHFEKLKQRTITLLHKGKYHFMAGFHIDRVGLYQTRKFNVI